MNKVYKFISDDLAEFLFQETLDCEDYDIDQEQVKGNKCSYNNSNMKRLLTLLKPKVEEVYGKRLHETYAFFRVYEEGQELPAHIDRPSCEVSVTICLGFHSQYLWPIYVDGVPYATKPGEGVVYKGCEQLHWREPFIKVQEQEGSIIWSQLFLHYIEAGGQYDPEHRWDTSTQKITLEGNEE